MHIPHIIFGIHHVWYTLYIVCTFLTALRNTKPRAWIFLGHLTQRLGWFKQVWDVPPIKYIKTHIFLCVLLVRFVCGSTMTKLNNKILSSSLLSIYPFFVYTIISILSLISFVSISNFCQIPMSTILGVDFVLFILFQKHNSLWKLDSILNTS